MMAVRIRNAVPGDVRRLAAVGRQAFLDAYGGTATRVDLERHVVQCFSETAIRLEMHRPTVRYALAGEGRTCAGMMKVRSDEVPPRLPSANAIEIQQLYVATEFQRKGAGGRLLDHAIRAARRGRKDGLWLSAWREADWAIGFYRRHGFESLGEIPFLLGETEYTDYLMWLPLTRESAATVNERSARRDAPRRGRRNEPRWPS